MKRDRIALIDADFLPWIVCHVKKSEKEKTLEDCKSLCDLLISDILNKTYATKYLLVLSAGKSYRNSIYPDYKAQRKYLPRPAYFENIRQYLREEKQAFSQEGLEADDIVVILKNRIPESFLVSNDKDLLNLEGSHYCPRKESWITTTLEQASYFFWASMIVGDSADNVKGLPGKGPKYAEKVLLPLVSGLREAVFSEYVTQFGEDRGIEEFYKNYKCLKIKEVDDSLITPKLLDYTSSLTAPT